MVAAANITSVSHVFKVCVCVFVRIRVVKGVTVLTQSLINKSLLSYWEHYGLSCSGGVSSELKKHFIAKNIASSITKTP